MADIVAPPSPLPGPPGRTRAAITLTRPARPGPGTRRSPVRIPRLARRIVGPLLVLGLWQLVCSLGVFTSVEVASPVAVLRRRARAVGQGVLQSNLLDLPRSGWPKA